MRGVCLDIDDTLTTHSQLTSSAFEALWALKSAGFAVVPVTGRPAGWCDHIARFWPVDGVIGENGAFAMYMEGGKLKRLTTPAAGAPGQEVKNRIELLGHAIRTRFPHAQWASDQAYREYDLAIDFCEDVPRWPQADIDELVNLCEAQGALAKVSSIHVNAWFGTHDKRAGFEHWVASRTGQPRWNEWLFIGDSPNDEPLFGAFGHSVGVANIRNFLSRLKNPPRWVTDAESGEGFVQMAKKLIEFKAF